jgi:pSer/pThr/pTyr-binding forkhead associated (FHA) protein
MEVKLVVANGKQAGTEIPVKATKFIIGRNEDCQLRPQSPLVSRHHCAILVEENSAAIEDLGSTNGTFLNGEKLAGRRELKTGDRIKVGLLELEVRVPVAVGGTPKSKIQSVQEAAARTAASNAAVEDDLDISRWFSDEEDNALSVPPPTKKQDIGDDTVAGRSLTDTTTIPAQAVPAQPAKEKEKESEKKKEVPAKTAGKLVRPPAKPTTENSGSAADDALRHFFHRKKA